MRNRINRRNLQRSEIIHNNFFKYLDEKDITFRKYADDNHIDRTISSKWRSGKSNMTVDQIYQAAEYFGITVNDLYYTEKEKKEIQVLSDSTYDPIMAQKTQDVKIFDNLFSNCFIVITFTIMIFAFLGHITHSLISARSSFWIFLIIAVIVFVRPLVMKFMTF